MNKILILGAGNAQIDAIRFCRQNGYEIYGCSYTNTDRGIPLLDHFKQIDIKNVLDVTCYAAENDIPIIYSVGSDLAMPTVMQVSESLNLKHFISSATAEICQEKNKLRAYLGNDFEGNIKFLAASCMKEALQFEFFPCMMKPVDSQGQRGCFKVNNKEEIADYFEKSKSFSKSGVVIIEQYIEGPEVSVNAYVVNGKLEFCMVTGREVFEELPGGIIKRHKLCKNLMEEDIIKRIKDLVKRTLVMLSILNGPVYFQIKVSEGKPYIIEVTPRLDGCHMWNGILHYCGVDLLKATLCHLISNDPGTFEYLREDDCTLEFMCSPPNVKFKREDFDISKSEYHEWYYGTGDIVKPLNGYMEKCGYQIYKGSE